MAAVVPCYALLSVIGYSVPVTQPISAFIGALSEGIAIWSFYKLCICGTSGYYEIINNFKNFTSWKAIPCSYCYQKLPECCWQFIEINIFLVLVFRPTLFLIYAFAEYYQRHGLMMVSSILAGIVLLFAMISLFRFYVGLGSLQKGLYLERKFLSIKIIVLVIVIENWVFNGWYLLNRGSPDAETKARSIRFFYLLVAVECFLFSIFLQFFFSTFDANALPSASTDKTTGKC
jgi:hypothetical protein